MTPVTKALVIEFANSSSPGQEEATRRAVASGMAVAGILGQVGCLTTALVLLALVGGLWLDAQFGTRPVLTLALVLGSVPVALYLMFRIVLAGARRVQSGKANPTGQTPADGEARGE
jgi:hypothetical protein